MITKEETISGDSITCSHMVKINFQEKKKAHKRKPLKKKSGLTYGFIDNLQRARKSECASLW